MLDDRASGPRGPTPHGLQAVDACPTCRITVAELLGSLPRNVVVELESRTTTREIAAGDVLCTAGEAARALYVLRAGRMKVRDGGRVVKICRAGEILDGGAVAAGLPNTVDILALDDCHVDVMALAPARLRALVVSAVNACAGAAHRQPRAQAIVLSADTIARLACVLADLGCFAGERTADGVRVPLTASHQRIGQLLALPESAVAHFFDDLETRGVLYADGTGVTILSSGRTGTGGAGSHVRSGSHVKEGL
jgi:CRP-like cAMP-binding protein